MLQRRKGMRPRAPRNVWMVGLLCLQGCGPVLFLSARGDAEEAIARADAAPEGHTSRYALRSAKEYLAEARVQAGVGAYGDAIAYAEAAREFGERALEGSGDDAPGDELEEEKP